MSTSSTCSTQENFRLAVPFDRAMSYFIPTAGKIGISHKVRRIEGMLSIGSCCKSSNSVLENDIVGRLDTETKTFVS